MITINQINDLLGIKESYQAPDKMLKIMLDKIQRENLFNAFLEIEPNLDYEWFQAYFENEHADRKNKKQDFTPKSVSKLLAKIVGNGDYFETAAGNGGILIQNWVENPNREFHAEELSERSVPFLLFNMVIRNMSGEIKNGDSLTDEFTKVFKLTKGDKFSEVEVYEL